MTPRYNFTYSLFVKKFLNSQCGQSKLVVFIRGCFCSKGNLPVEKARVRL